MPGRGNGLEASSYTPLVDLEPQLADAMLEVLRDEGVAAYVVPAVQHSAGLTVKEFRGPLDRLWVDATAKPRAKQVLDARLPGLRAELEGHSALGGSGAVTAEPRGREHRPAEEPPGERRPDERRPDAESASPPASGDEQDAWAAIVASFNASPDDAVPRWPVAEDVEDVEDGGDGRSGAGRERRRPADDSDSPKPEPPPEDAPYRDGPPGTAEAAEGAGPDAGSVHDRDDDHFVPPPPPPLPRADGVTKAAWIALIGGPLYLLVAAMISLEIGPWSAFLAAAAFVGGFVTLVARMGDRPPTDSGPDDGAVV